VWAKTWLSLIVDRGLIVVVLVGMIVSFVYAVIYKLWLKEQQSKLGNIQWASHQAGTLILVVALYCLYGRIIPEAVLGPILGIGSLLILVSMILMKICVINSRSRNEQEST